ncbi:hypothetical protein ACRS34_13670 [Stutzerimonas stutzeri]|uniref:hypothetical protein n=1 Tax=Stutzerimonas stutzeri TaxID=316 RepID=UPI003EE26D50
MGIVRSLFGWMQASPARGDNPALYPLDFDELKKELSVVDEARRMGVHNNPPEDKTGLSAVEERIVSRIEEYRHKVIGWSHDHMVYLKRHMSELDVTKDINRARESSEEFKRRANDVIASHDHELHQLDAEAQRLTTQLELFKAKNRLHREPKQPMGALSRWLWILIIALLVILEGAANAYFFSAGLAGGLAQGFVYAGMLSAINVLGGFFIGKKGLKYLWHVSPFAKLIGVISLLAALALLFGIALITTHLRDAFAVVTLDGDAMAIAHQTMLASPFGFHGIDSIILFLMSAIFSILALVKGLTWGDIYPGYSSESDRVIEARALHDSLVELVRDELSDLKEEFEKTLDSTLETAKRDIVKLKELAENKSLAGQRFTNYQGKAEHMLHALIELFRTENTIHRKTPAPAYFNEKVLLPPVEAKEVDLQDDLIDIARQEALLDELLAEVEPIRGQIQSAFVSCYDQVTPLRDHLKSA